MSKKIKLLVAALLYAVLSLTTLAPRLAYAEGQPCCQAEFPGDPSYVFNGVDSATKKCMYIKESDPKSQQWGCAMDGTESCDIRLNLGMGICKRGVVAANPRGESGAGQCPVDSIATGFGCVPTQPGAFISRVLQIGIGVASGVAFLLIVFGAYKVLSAHGNPEGLNAGKETITSAIVGLIFIVMSVTILQVIGIDILRLNNLSGPNGNINDPTLIQR